VHALNNLPLVREKSPKTWPPPRTVWTRVHARCGPNACSRIKSKPPANVRPV
jgi:hypothetical protein